MRMSLSQRHCHQHQEAHPHHARSRNTNTRNKHVSDNLPCQSSCKPLGYAMAMAAQGRSGHLLLSRSPAAVAP